jgi:hypothetical protein
LHLSDFGGAANLIPKDINFCAHQTPYIDTKYHAPEKVINNMKKMANITKQNVWSIGVIAYELCTFNYLFEREAR